MTKSTPSQEKGWCSFSLSFLDTTDWDTVARYGGLERLAEAGATVRLTYRASDQHNRPVYISDEQIADARAIREFDGEEVGGIVIVATNDDGEASEYPGDQRFIRYEDIIDIGVY